MRALENPREKSHGSGCCSDSGKYSLALVALGDRRGLNLLDRCPGGGPLQMATLLLYFFRRRVKWQGGGRLLPRD